MSLKTLAQLYSEHDGKVSDKWSGYLSEYNRIFRSYRSEPVRFLEIGVQNGGSLEIWAKYFQNGKVFVGCDINPDCARLQFHDSRIALVIGDASTGLAQSEVFEHSDEFDIVIDDGSHISSDIIKSFVSYFPKIIDGGVFVAEDLHCSYWEVYEGGLFDPLSSMSFFKLLADVINHEHWGVDKDRVDLFDSFADKYGIEFDNNLFEQVHSIEFSNSICVIHKSSAKNVLLGRRFISGKELCVEKEISGSHGDELYVMPQKGNFWSVQAWTLIKKFPKQLSELNDSLEQLRELNDTVIDNERKIIQLTSQIEEMSQSTSWKITRPLRWLGLQARCLMREGLLIINTVHHFGGIVKVSKKIGRIFKKEGVEGIKKRVVTKREFLNNNERVDYSRWIQQYDILTNRQRDLMAARIMGMSSKPLISILMPVFNSNIKWLRQAIESVQQQLYQHWELCIADDLSTEPAVRELLAELSQQDYRIKVVFREENGHISYASNSALELATGDWVALLDHDDLLSEHALFWVVDAINDHPDVRMIYSDEDKVDENDKRQSPYFKCGWNPDLFYSHNMFCHLGVYKRDLLIDVGGFRAGLEGAQDYDLVLRCIEHVAASEIYHIPRVLYHWRKHENSTSLSREAKPYAVLAGERALNEHLERSGVAAKAESLAGGYRVRYILPEKLPMVSIIVPTKNHLKLIQQCVASILDKTTYSNYEILIVDNGSDESDVLDYFKSLSTDARVRILKDDRPFNYSQLNNSAIDNALGEVVCLLNNDIEVINAEWLTEMVSHAIRPEIGAVGAKLLYPNNTLQHAGVILGIGGVAGHAHKCLSAENTGYFSRADVISGFSAVTAACLVIQKEIYKKAGGLNEHDLKVAFNDVDFCLRVRELGYRNLWTPYARLYHHESVSRGYEDTPEKQARFESEVRYMMSKWGAILDKDPAYSLNLTLEHEDFSYAWPPRINQSTVESVLGLAD